MICVIVTKDEENSSSFMYRTIVGYTLVLETLDRDGVTSGNNVDAGLFSLLLEQVRVLRLCRISTICFYKANDSRV